MKWPMSKNSEAVRLEWLTWSETSRQISSQKKLPSMRATEERRTIAFFVDGGSRVAQVLGLENSQLVQPKTTQPLKIHMHFKQMQLPLITREH